MGKFIERNGGRKKLGEVDGIMRKLFFVIYILLFSIAFIPISYADDLTPELGVGHELGKSNIGNWRNFAKTFHQKTEYNSSVVGWWDSRVVDFFATVSKWPAFAGAGSGATLSQTTVANQPGVSNGIPTFDGNDIYFANDSSVADMTTNDFSIIIMFSASNNTIRPFSKGRGGGVTPGYMMYIDGTPKVQI